MFEVENLNEFINRMFDNAVKSKSDVKEGLITFRKYLDDTSMCDEDYLRMLDKIIECSSELLALKKKINDFDVAFFVENSLNNQNQSVVPKQKKKSQVRRSVVSDRCGSSSSSTNNRCGGTSIYSDSCGGGSYTDRC